MPILNLETIQLVLNKKSVYKKKKRNIIIKLKYPPFQSEA